jgi:hypothetical protein
LRPQDDRQTPLRRTVAINGWTARSPPRRCRPGRRRTAPRRPGPAAAVNLSRTDSRGPPCPPPAWSLAAQPWRSASTARLAHAYAGVSQALARCGAGRRPASRRR